MFTNNINYTHVIYLSFINIFYQQLKLSLDSKQSITMLKSNRMIVLLVKVVVLFIIGIFVFF